jgi:DNA-binding transcriptional MerR regulator
MRENFQRPVDLARAYGLSTQAIRNYEQAGILPVAARSETGYRAYTPLHASALAAFLALRPGHGHPTATAIMQSVNRGAVDQALRLIDESHAQLLEDRRTLRAVEAALRDLTTVPPADGAGRGAGGATRGDTFVGPLARRLGIEPATLRKWEVAGLVRPRRDPQTHYRVYGPSDVRDARLVHQLRRGGYRLDQIAPLLTQIRTAGGIAPVESMLQAWTTRLSTRSRHLLSGAAALDAYLTRPGF